MKKKILVILTFLLVIVSVGCNGKNSTIAEDDGSLPDINSDSTSGMKEASDDTTTEKDITDETNQTQDLLSADALAYKMIFEEENPIAKDMGTYVETLNAYQFDNINYNGKSVTAIELFWQCEGGKGSDYASWFDKEQWAVVLYYDNEKLIDLDAFPCEYSMVTTALSTVKLMQKEEGVNLLYNIYFDDEYASLVTKK